MADKNILFLANFGATIRQLRIQERISRSNFGKVIGMSVFKIDQLENGKMDVDLEAVFDITYALQVTTATFFEIVEARKFQETSQCLAKENHQTENKTCL
jgi:transcriptional regulator with XRE-family HTH domain